MLVDINDSNANTLPYWLYPFIPIDINDNTMPTHVMTLPDLNTLTQGSLLELNLMVQGCDDNTVNSFEPIESLSLVYHELIDPTLQD